MNTVSALFWNPVTAAGYFESLFVQFDDSKDVYSMDVTSEMQGVFNLVASPNSGGGGSVIVAPSLNAKFEDVHKTANHSVHGIAHFLGHSNAIPTVYVALIDSDRDGDLDLIRALTDSQWASETWGDATAYLTVYDP